MIEYLYNAIRATAGQEILIAATVTDDSGDVIKDGCRIVLYIDDIMLTFAGSFNPSDNLWTFSIPAEATEGLIGRYEYCIQRNGANLCFKEPIYFV